jgi:copper(I)-binding protein
MNTSLKLIVIFFLSLCISTPAMSSSIVIQDAFARASIGLAKNGVVFMSIYNRSDKSDQLLGVQTDIAKNSSLHSHLNNNGIMKMRRVARIAIPRNSNIELKPGGFHVMLMGLKKPLTEGNQFNLTLVFKNTGKLTVPVKIKKVAEMPPHKKTKRTK